MSGGRRPERDPIWLGVAGAVVIAIIAYAVFAKRVPLTHPYRVDAVVSSSSQLRKGSPVRIAGVDVGKVAGTRRGPGHTTIVRLEIPDGAKLVHTDATLRIRPRLFLEGAFYVDLEQGSPTAPRMRDGGTIPLGQTAIPVQFNDVLDTLDRPARDSFRGIIARFSAATGKGGAQGLHDAAPAFARALPQAALLAEAARGTRTHDVSRLIGGASRVTAALASREAQLGRLVDSLAQTSHALAAGDGALGRSVAASDRLLADAPAALRAVDRALPSATRLSTALRPSLRAAPPALRDATRLVGQLGALTRPSQLPRLLTTIAPLVRELPSTESRLEALFGQVTPVSDCVRTRVVPVLETKLDDGVLSTGRPVSDDILHAAVGLASSSGSFDANGPYIRYLLGTGFDSLDLETIAGIGKPVAKALPSALRTRPKPLPDAAVPAARPDHPCRDQPLPSLATPDVPIHTFDQPAGQGRR